MLEIYLKEEITNLLFHPEKILSPLALSKENNPWQGHETFSRLSLQNQTPRRVVAILYPYHAFRGFSLATTPPFA